jgi:hypothetical protein
MTDILNDTDWDLLMRRIKSEKCTPFLGAGACYGHIPLGKEIAEIWSIEHSYPMSDVGDLIRVAQFIAIKYDAMVPKEEIIERWISVATLPNFDEESDPHSILAKLPLPIYMTTNYDDFMFSALSHRQKDPKWEICRWNNLIKELPNVPKIRKDFRPTPANPLVFHLHGHKSVVD